MGDTTEPRMADITTYEPGDNLQQVGWITRAGALHTFGVHERQHSGSGFACQPVYVVETTT